MDGKLLALDPKRRRFVEEYRLDWNATAAAIRAGYTPKTAQQQGSQLLAKLSIQKALVEVMAEEAARSEISADQIIAETAKLAFLNMMDYLRIGENGEPWVDLSALTRAQAAGLLSFKHKEYKEGRGEDARDVCEVEIRLRHDYWISEICGRRDAIMISSKRSDARSSFRSNSSRQSATISRLLDKVPTSKSSAARPSLTSLARLPSSLEWAAIVSDRIDFSRVSRRPAPIAVP
jgi:phage terminase small subunit